VKLLVNGAPQELPDGLTVQEALDRLGLAGGPHAVAVNLEFVPRSEHAKVTLKDGDEVDVVAPQQGG
jgi:sulfur carrier protein